MLHTPESPNPAVMAEFNKIQEHAFKGVINGCKKIYSNTLQPISSFIYDAAIVGSKNLSSVPEFSELHTLVTKCPDIYNASHQRMQRRISHLETHFKQFSDLDSGSKIEFFTEQATQFLVPGAIFKGIHAYSKFKLAGVVAGVEAYDKITSDLDSYTTTTHLLLYNPSNPSSTRLVPIKNTEQDIAPRIRQEDLDILCPQWNNIPTLETTVKQSYNKYKENLNDKGNLRHWASNMQEIANIGCNVSHVALAAGLHGRTWRNVGSVCSGLATMSSSLLTLTSSTSFLSLAGGYIGVGIGLMTSIMGLFGQDEEDNGLEQLGEYIKGMLEHVLGTIMGALETIQMTIVDGFKRIEGTILTSVIPRLMEINSKLDRLESITCLSFKELHTKSLIDLIYIITQDLVGENTLSVSDRRGYMRELAAWIECHSKSAIQTGVYRSKVGSDGIAVEVLGSFERPLDGLTFLLMEIKRLTGMEFGVLELPNIPTYLVALDVYVSSVMKYGENIKVLERARNTLEQIDVLIGKMRDSGCYDVLMRQYEYYRFLVGRQIEKCRLEYDNDKPLREYLKYGEEYEKLLKLFDGLELRRQMIMCVGEICGIPTGVLESKVDILETRECEKIIKAAYSSTIDEEKLKRALGIGLSVNHFDEWGQPIHYVTRNKSRELHKLLPLLFRCPEVSINEYMKYNMNDTWGPSVRPILYAMHGASFDAGFLFCAQGHNINEVSNARAYYHPHENPWPYFYLSDVGNAYFLEKEHHVYKFTISVAKTTNDVKSKFYRNHLRKAYEYYKTVSSGLSCNTEGVSGECLLLLACLIGDLYPVVYSKLKVDINAKIEAHGLTYLMLASYCGNMEVVKYLLERGADVDAKTDTKYATAEDFAKLRNHENIVEVLKNGIKVVEEHKESIKPFTCVVNRIDRALKLSRNIVKDDNGMKLLIRLLKATMEKLGEDDRNLVNKYLAEMEERPEEAGRLLEDIETVYLINGMENVSRKIQKALEA